MKGGERARGEREKGKRRVEAEGKRERKERRKERRRRRRKREPRNMGSRVDPAYGQHRSARAPCQGTADGS